MEGHVVPQRRGARARVGRQDPHQRRQDPRQEPDPVRQAYRGGFRAFLRRARRCADGLPQVEPLRVRAEDVGGGQEGGGGEEDGGHARDPALLPVHLRAQDEA